jgi:hypothetical protein
MPCGTKEKFTYRERKLRRGLFRYRYCGSIANSVCAASKGTSRHVRRMQSRIDRQMRDDGSNFRPVANTALRSILAILLVLGLTGCVGNKPYRTQVIPLPVATQQVPATPANPPKTTYKNQRPGIVLATGDVKYDLAYIEFDDMGEYWTIGNLTDKAKAVNDSQVERTVRLIQLRQQEGKSVAVIAFIHGWKNNASPYDEENDKNLHGFEDTMKKIASDDPDRDRHYIAVFIAWRGQVLSGNLFTSYWNRRSAAMRVGGPSMTEAIFRLMFVTKPPVPPTFANSCGDSLPRQEPVMQGIGRDPVTGKGIVENAIPGFDQMGGERGSSVAAENGSFVKNRFVLVSHSFGARVMERALGQPLMSLLYERRSEAVDCVQQWNASHPDHLSTVPVFQSPADLITMINSANDSFESKSMIEGMTRMGLVSCIGAKCKTRSEIGNDPTQHPLIVSILSENDSATTKIMPVAQRLSYFGQNLDRKYDEPAADRGQIDVKKQRTFFLKNEGSIDQLVSHDLTGANATSCSGDLQFSYENTCFTLAPHEQKAGTFQNTTPFWVFKVPKALIPNHSNIFQGGTVALLSRIVENAMQSKDPLNLTIY